MSKRIYTYDTTLRDGAQTEGISFSEADKLDIISRLDDFGMDFIEGGMPSSNPKDRGLFSRELPAKRSKIVAFGSTCRPGTKPENDENLSVLAQCDCEWVCIFGKSSLFQVEQALGTSPEENLRMISDSISFLRSKGKKVIFDAEHFFDGYRDNREYALSVIETAKDSEWIVLCDTNGGSLPSFISKATADVASSRKNIGIHCHNDSDLAVACTLAAVEGGATMVQGTVNGIGERCGNANLCSVIPDLRFKMDMDVPVQISKLTELSFAVSETANMRHVAHMPYVGEKAFAHKGGMHVSALMKDTRTYEHVSPETVGNKRRVLISDMSGRASIAEKIREMGIDATDEQIKSVTEKIKEMESGGYQYEGADASFQLLVKRLKENYCRPFTVRGFRLSIDGIGVSDLRSEASIKVNDSSGNEEHTASDGDGPVNALDKSLRKALAKFYPIINNVRLTDYKVRVLDEKAATAAVVRVIIRSTDGKREWSTVGVSGDVIEASLIALSDSMEYIITINN